MIIAGRLKIDPADRALATAIRTEIKRSVWTNRRGVVEANSNCEADAAGG